MISLIKSSNNPPCANFIAAHTIIKIYSIHCFVNQSKNSGVTLRRLRHNGHLRSWSPPYSDGANGRFFFIAGIDGSDYKFESVNKISGIGPT